MLQDFRFALRLFRSHRGTTLLAALTLALGIGATTTVFGIFDVLFVRPLAVPAPERLVRLQLVAKERRMQTALSYPLFADLREHVNAFSHIAGYVEGAAAVQLGDYSDRLTVECVTSEYFALLGARPEIGRWFSAGEEARREPVAILSHGLWQRIFDGNPRAVGATVTVNGQPFTVIGIAGEAFTGVRQAAGPGLWVPAPWFLSFVGIPDLLQQRGVGFLGVIARLAEGAEAASAGDQATAVAARVEPNLGEARLTAVPAERGDDEGVQALHGPVRLVGAAVLLLLVMACVNVMHILLAWGEGRRREVAIRLALGGSRARVLRQFLTESLTLAVAGLALGVLLVSWALDLLPRVPALQAAGVQIAPRLDARVLAASLAASLLSVLVAGLLPALRAARQSVMDSIRRAPVGSGRWRAGSVLAVGQVALALVLLATAGLFARSLSQLGATETNLATDRVLAVQAQFGMDATVEHRRIAAGRLLEGLATLPGVISASAGTTLPVSTSGMQQRFDAGTTVPAIDADAQVELQFVSPEYFATLGLPLVDGRALSAADANDVIIVNESFARRYWPGERAVGQTFTQKSTSGDEVFRVVGVARDSKYRSLRESGTLAMYRPLGQFPARTLALLIRAEGPPATLAGAVRQRVREIEPGVTIWNARTLADHVDRSLELDRARTLTLGIFAGLALLLVSLGVYGIMAYSVSRRLREIGIRLALGASPRTVGRLILLRAAALVGTGILLGLGGIHAGGRLVAAELHGVSPWDPAALAGSGALLLAIALAASFLPARRASRVDPTALLSLE